VLGAQHSDFAGADRARSGQSEDVTLLPSGRREAEEPLTVAVVSAPPHSMRSASRRAPLRFHRSRPASLRRLFVREPGAQAPKPRNRRQSTSKATTAPTSRRLPASVARTRWDASERLWARRPVPRRFATTGKEIELRGGHQIGPISASGIAVSCLGGLRGPENRAPFLVRLSSIRSDMTRIVAG
jgi:hypothetical protein